MKQTDKVKSIIFAEVRHNASITTNQLKELIGLKKTSLQNILHDLASRGAKVYMITSRGANNLHVLKKCWNIAAF